MKTQLLQHINKAILLKKHFFETEMDHAISQGHYIVQCLQNGYKILVCGNGGSAADAQHFVAELTGRYLKMRKALPGIALTVNSSNLTAIGNDYGFDNIFSRQIEALGKPKDLLIAISTSGNSLNVINAVNTANRIGLHTIGLLGHTGGKLKSLVNDPIIVHSNITSHVQEIHMAVYHLWCIIIDSYFKKL